MLTTDQRTKQDIAYKINWKGKMYFRNENDMLKCGEIRYAYLPELVGGSFHMQQGLRPVLIVSNDMNNKATCGNVQVIPFTTKEKKPIPTHVRFSKDDFGLSRDSILLAECETQIPACYVYNKVGKINDDAILNKIANAIIIQHGLLFTVLQNRACAV